MTIANVEMAKAWDEESEHWTRHADRYDAVGARIWEHFLDGGHVGTSDHVLDIGCGTGGSTLDVAEVAGSGSALGVDIAARMLEVAEARRLAQEVPNAEFLHADAQVHPFPEALYDVAISLFGAMFFADPVAAFGNVARALRPDGRLALLAWQPLARNDWLTALWRALAPESDLLSPPPDAPTPFSQSDPDRVRRILGDAGFEQVALESVERPMCFGSDAEDAWSFISGFGIVRGITGGLDDASRAQAFEELQRVLASRATPEGVLLGGAAWLITARRG